MAQQYNPPKKRDTPRQQKEMVHKKHTNESKHQARENIQRRLGNTAMTSIWCSGCKNTSASCTLERANAPLDNLDASSYRRNADLEQIQLEEQHVNAKCEAIRDPITCHKMPKTKLESCYTRMHQPPTQASSLKEYRMKSACQLVGRSG